MNDTTQPDPTAIIVDAWRTKHSVSLSPDAWDDLMSLFDKDRARERIVMPHMSRGGALVSHVDGWTMDLAPGTYDILRIGGEGSRQ